MCFYMVITPQDLREGFFIFLLCIGPVNSFVFFLSWLFIKLHICEIHNYVLHQFITAANIGNEIIASGL